MIREGKKNNRLKTDEGKRGENQPFHVKHGQADKQQVVCGMRPVLEAIEADSQIDKILLQTTLDGQLSKELRTKARERNLPVQFVPVERLNAITGANHQGVVALIAPIAYRSFADMLQSIQEGGKQPFFLMLDHVTDVRNLGAIARTAECAGVDAIIVPDHGSAQIGADAIKSSSGALLRLPVCREANLKTVINLALQTGLQVCAATEKGSTSYVAVDFRKPTLLVMGSEDKGISTEVLKLCDVRAKLPIVGQVQSLNVSVAAGIFMYEVLRQRGIE